MSVWLIPTLAALGIGYVLGSIPSAFWICRLFYKVDITQIGSNNPGMTNVWRTLGWKPALPVAFIDALKGTLSAWIGLQLGKSTGSFQALALVAGVAAVIGHSLSFLAHFKGGKSVLTAFGVFLAISPIASLSALAVWGLVMWRLRIVSLASLSSAFVLPPFIALETLWHGRTWPSLLGFVSLAVSAFVIWRHRSNIQRLIQGTEASFKRSPK